MTKEDDQIDLVIDRMPEDLWVDTSPKQRKRLARLFIRASDVRKRFGGDPDDLVRTKPSWIAAEKKIQTMNTTPVGERNRRNDEREIRERILAFGATGPHGNPDRTLLRLRHEARRVNHEDLDETGGKRTSKKGWHSWKDRIDSTKRAKKRLQSLPLRPPSLWGEQTRADVAKNMQKNT